MDSSKQTPGAGLLSPTPAVRTSRLELEEQLDALGDRGGAVTAVLHEKLADMDARLDELEKLIASPEWAQWKRVPFNEHGAGGGQERPVT